MLDTLSAEEIQDWWLKYQVDPFGDETRLLARLIAKLHNTHAGPQDTISFYDVLGVPEPPPAEPVGDNQMRLFAQHLNSK